MVAGLLLALIVSSKTTVIQFDAVVRGAKVGHSTYTTVRDVEGATTVTIDTTFTSGEPAVRAVGVYAYRKDGRPITSEFKRTGVGPSLTSKKTYGSSSVKVEEFSNGKLTETKNTPIPPKAVLIDPTWDWFWKRMPKKGETAKYQSLNVDGKWETRTTTYRGEVTLKLATKQVSAHLIDGGDLKSWVDDQGDLLRTDLLVGGEKFSLMRTSIKRF